MRAGEPAQAQGFIHGGRGGRKDNPRTGIARWWGTAQDPSLRPPKYTAPALDALAVRWKVAAAQLGPAADLWGARPDGLSRGLGAPAGHHRQA